MRHWVSCAINKGGFCVDTHLPRFEAIAYVLPHFDGLTHVVIRVAWVSGVSGGKRERWKRKRERAEGEKRLTQMLLLEPSTPTQHDSIPSNQNHFRSLGCQLHVSKSSPKINLTLRSGRAPVLVLLWFRSFLKPPLRSFRIPVMENLPFLRNYSMF